MKRILFLALVLSLAVINPSLSESENLPRWFPEDSSLSTDTLPPTATPAPTPVVMDIPTDGVIPSGLSFDELVSLREQINLSIWNCHEWQEITVPAGVYTIGVDIPAGHWSLRVAARHDSFLVVYCDKLNAIGKDVGYGATLYQQSIATSDYSPFGAIPVTEIDIDMQEGWYLILDGATVFTPYIGKPDFGFKK